MDDDQTTTDAWDLAHFELTAYRHLTGSWIGEVRWNGAIYYSTTISPDERAARWKARRWLKTFRATKSYDEAGKALRFH